MRTRALLLVLLLATACGSASAPSRILAVPTPLVSADPMDLVGMWRAQVDGKDAGVVRIGEELTLFQDCGALDAGWKASHDGGFLAYSSAGDGTCFKDNAPLLPPWVHSARGYRVAGEQRSLVDAAGRVLVTLLPGGRPQHRANRSPETYATPSPTASLAARMAAPAPLPAGLTAATEDSLVGVRWRAADNPKAYLEFATDGSYAGTDGCNGAGGRYSLGPAGELLSVGGPSTLIGCANSAAPGWIAATARLGLDGGQLVLLDARAHELGRLTHP